MKPDVRVLAPTSTPATPYTGSVKYPNSLCLCLLPFFTDLDVTFQSIGPQRQRVRPSVLVFTFEVPFKRLFASTFQSRMSNIVRVSESLGKMNGKKGSQIGTFLFGSGCKSPNNFFLLDDFASQNKVETTLPACFFHQQDKGDFFFSLYFANTKGKHKNKNRKKMVSLIVHE